MGIPNILLIVGSIIILSLIITLVIITITDRIESSRYDDFIETCKIIEGQIRRKRIIDIDSFNMDHNEKIKYESYDVNIKSLIDAFNSKYNTTADMVSIITHYNGII